MPPSSAWHLERAQADQRAGTFALQNEARPGLEVCRPDAHAVVARMLLEELVGKGLAEELLKGVGVEAEVQVAVAPDVVVSVALVRFAQRRAHGLAVGAGADAHPRPGG